MATDIFGDIFDFPETSATKMFRTEVLVRRVSVKDWQRLADQSVQHICTLWGDRAEWLHVQIQRRVNPERRMTPMDYYLGMVILTQTQLTLSEYQELFTKHQVL